MASIPSSIAGLNVRNNHAMDMSLCHGGVLVEHECVCESRRVRVLRVGACRTIVESGREREFRRSRWSFGARTMSGACAGMLCTHLTGLIES
jgi:hypothetical protein